MAEIRINQTTPTEVLRHKLKSFGTFSELEITSESDLKNGEKGIIFREVKLGERLRRFLFEDKKNIEEGRKKSQEFLKSFAENRPDILKTLGISIIEKNFWTAGEFLNHLKIKADIIKKDEENGLFRTPENFSSTVGVVDAKVSEIEADKFIEWSFHTPKPGQKNFPYITTEKNSKNEKQISVVCKKTPNGNDLRRAYKAALSGASGHVVLSPIYDVPVHRVKNTQPDYAENSRFYDIQSDNNLRILIEEIDSAIRENKNITKVTIARGDTPDAWFLSRVLAQRAIFDKKKNDSNGISTTNLASMPPSLQLISDEIGGKYNLLVKSENDVSRLKKTELSQVGLYTGDPGTVTADTAFLTFGSVDRCASALASSGMKQFQRVRNLIFNSESAINKEVLASLSGTVRQWGIPALELPLCEMPSNKLYAINQDDLASMTPDLAKMFFIRHLEDLEGRVVLEITGNDVLDKALWEALQDLNSKFQTKGLQCILASPDQAVMDRFLENIVEPPLDIDGDDDDRFDYLSQLQNKRRR